MLSAFSHLKEEFIKFNQFDLENTLLLMNRVDFKFVLKGIEAAQLLKTLEKDYDLITKEGNLSRIYETVYFDTVQRDAFYRHHQGKLPRYKIRTRTYLDTNDRFLEIKYKNNRGRTEKFRHKLSSTEYIFEQSGVVAFLNEHNIDNLNELKKALLVKYKRISLKHKKLNERITIDFDISFSNGLKNALLGEVVFMEVKQEKSMKSPVMIALKAMNKHSVSLSKYCYGLLSLEPSIKHNNFNPLKKSLNKIISIL